MSGVWSRDLCAPMKLAPERQRRKVRRSQDRRDHAMIGHRHPTRSRFTQNTVVSIFYSSTERLVSDSVLCIVSAVPIGALSDSEVTDSDTGHRYDDRGTIPGTGRDTRTHSLTLLCTVRFGSAVHFWYRINVNLARTSTDSRMSWMCSDQSTTAAVPQSPGKTAFRSVFDPLARLPTSPLPSSLPTSLSSPSGEAC